MRIKLLVEKNMQYFIKAIKMFSKDIKINIIDVGAMGGLSKIWGPIESIINAIGFEPDPIEFEKLKEDKNVKYYNYALYSESKNLEFNIARGGGKSSLLIPNEKFLEKYSDYNNYVVEEKKPIPKIFVKTLDELVKQNEKLDPDFIKLDTQGSELEILRGSEKVLTEKVCGCLIEISFVETYKNQPLFREIDSFMEQKGFNLFDIKRYYWKKDILYNYRGKGQLIMGDALYFKKYEEIKHWSFEKVLRFITLLYYFGYYDYAIEIVKNFILRHNSDLNNYNALEKIIISDYLKGNKIFDFKGSSIIYRLARFFTTKLSKSGEGRYDSDLYIGNRIDQQ